MLAPDGLPKPRRYVAIAALGLGTALAVIDGAIVSVALPTLARDLHVAESSAVLVVTVYQLVLVMTLLPFSALGSRIGLKRLYQYGQLIFLVTSLLCFFARSLPFLLVVRALQSLGAAASLSVMSALIRAVYPTKQLGRGLGINSIIVSASSAIAPALGGLMLQVARWPWIFAVAAPLAVLSLLLGRSALPAPETHREPYDVLAALLCALTFGLIIAGLESSVHGDSPVIAMTIVACGVLFAVIFVRRELSSKRPILPVDLLAQPAVALAASGGLIAFVASMMLVLSLPFRLQHYGFTPGQVGSVIAPWPLGMLVVAPIAGILSDRFPAGFLGAIGMSVATCGLLLMAYLPEHLTMLDVEWRMALCGSGFGLFFTPNSRVIVHAAPRERAASAGALISTTRFIGQTLGATLLAALLTLHMGSNRVPAFVAAVLTALAGVFGIARLSVSIEGRRPSDPPPL